MSKLRGRVALVGVGDARHGDDGAGPMIAGLLSKGGLAGVFDVGPTPEVETWRIREFAPETVLFIDAVDFGGRPGDVAFLEVDQLRISGFDTHRAPLSLTMRYLASELGAKCYVLGIQPKDVRLGASMCEEVESSVSSLARVIRAALAGKG